MFKNYLDHLTLFAVIIAVIAAALEYFLPDSTMHISLIALGFWLMCIVLAVVCTNSEDGGNIGTAFLVFVGCIVFEIAFWCAHVFRVLVFG